VFDFHGSQGEDFKCFKRINWVENGRKLTFNQEVMGSNPIALTNEAIEIPMEFV